MKSLWLERVNAFANVLPRGQKESAGLMANYRYVPEDFESNRQRYTLYFLSNLNYARRPLKQLNNQVKHSETHAICGLVGLG